ncbi:hypothetical protein D3C71_1366250 [compost metagenome]
MGRGTTGTATRCRAYRARSAYRASNGCHGCNGVGRSDPYGAAGGIPPVRARGFAASFPSTTRCACFSARRVVARAVACSVISPGDGCANPSGPRLSHGGRARVSAWGAEPGAGDPICVAPSLADACRCSTARRRARGGGDQTTLARCANACRVVAAIARCVTARVCRHRTGVAGFAGPATGWPSCAGCVCAGRGNGSRRVRASVCRSARLGLAR